MGYKIEEVANDSEVMVAVIDSDRGLAAVAVWRETHTDNKSPLDARRRALSEYHKHLVALHDDANRQAVEVRTAADNLRHDAAVVSIRIEEIDAQLAELEEAEND